MYDEPHDDNNRSPGTCIHCREMIVAEASVCKHCGNFQNRFLHYAKVAAIPFGLIASAIGLFSVANSISYSSPEPEVQISSVNVDNDGVDNDGVDLTLLNYGTGPTQISIMFVESSMAIEDGREDAFSGNLYPEGMPIIKPGDVETVRFNFENFRGSGVWRSETGRRSFGEGPRSFRLNSKCEVKLWHSTPEGFDVISGDISLSLCAVLENVAFEWYAENFPELIHPSSALK